MAILMKQGGVWKDTTEGYIKVNGVWRIAGATYIKNGGTWADTSRLSDTKLDYDMTIAKEADGSRYLVEKNDPTLHKAPLHSGHSITLTGTGKIEVPINAHLRGVTDYAKATLATTDIQVVHGIVTDEGDHFLVTSTAGKQARIIMYVIGATTFFENVPVPLTEKLLYSIKIDYDTVEGGRTFSPNMGNNSDPTTIATHDAKEYSLAFEIESGYDVTNKYFQTYAGVDGKVKIYKDVQLKTDNIVDTVQGSVTIFSLGSNTFEQVVAP